MKLKRILASILVIFAVLGAMGTVAFAEGTAVATVNGVEYSSFTEVLDAVKASTGNNVTLLAEASVSGQNALDALTGDTLDLNDNTLTVEGNSYFSDGTTTFKNGNIVVTGYASDSYFCGYTEDAIIVFDDVVITGDDYTTGCALFNANKGSVEIKASQITVEGDTTGGVIYGGAVTIDSTTITATNVCRGITNSVAEIKNSSAFTFDGGETGFNNSTVTVDASEVEIKNATKRAVRLDDDTLTLQNGATLTATDCVEDIVAYKEESMAVVNVDDSSTLDAVNNIVPPAAIVATVNGEEFTDLQEAIKAAQVGDTVTIKEGTYALPSVKAGITIEGEGEVVLEGTLEGTLENLTLKNLHIKGSNAQRWAYAKGDLLFENVTFEATSVYAIHFDGITAGANLLYKDCTIIGWAAMSGSPASCVFDGCTIKDNGRYGLIRAYFDAEIKNCTFDVDGANTEDVYQEGIHAVGSTIEVNNCTNANGDIKDILNISREACIYVDDELALYPAGTDTWDGTVDTSWYDAENPRTEYTLTTAEQFAGFAKLVDEWDIYNEEEEAYLAFEGVTIRLGRDISFEGENYNPVGDFRTEHFFCGIFDGQNFSIKNAVKNSFDDSQYGSKEGWGIFSATYKAQIKNLVVDGAVFGSYTVISGGVTGYSYDTNYYNVAVKNTLIHGYNWNFGGVVGWASGSDLVFEKVIVDETNDIGTLWGSYDTAVGGIIGGIGSTTHVTFKDCEVSCTLDVVNDLAANYQWGAYRYSGMLIGKGVQTYTLESGKEVPDPSAQVTCENVKVTIGEWANFHYCESEAFGKPSYAEAGEWKYRRVELSNVAGDDWGNGGIDTNACVHDTDEDHNILMPFNQLFGGNAQGVYGANVEVLEELGYFDDNTVVVEDLALIANSVAVVDGVYYNQLQEAIDATNGNGTVVLTKNTTGDVTVSAPVVSLLANGGTEGVVIDLNGFTHNGTVTVAENATASLKNGTITHDKVDDFSAVESKGNTTIENVNISSTRHCVRVEGGLTTINGGSFSIIGVGRTHHAVNVSDGGEVIIYDGTFTGPAGLNSDSGSAVCVQAGSKVTIYGGKFTGGKLNTLAVKDTGVLEIRGGIFDQDPTAYVADGFVVASSNSASLYAVTTPRTIELVPEKEEVKTEEEFKIDVMIDVAEAKGVTWTLTYDDTYFELVGIETNYTRMNNDKLAPEIIADTGIIDTNAPVATYKFKAKTQAVEDSSFELTHANIRTSFDAWEDIDVSNCIIYKNTDVTVVLREYEDVTTYFEGIATEESQLATSYDGDEHKFEVTTSTQGATVSYTVNGEATTGAPVLTKEGTYEIVYTIDGVAGYKPVVEMVTVTIGEPEYVVEVAFGEDSDYVDGMKLVLVYTNAKNVGFDFDGAAMYNVSDAGYKYQEITEYDYVYALVVDALAENVLEAYEAFVTVDYSERGEAISYVNALDVNQNGSVTWDDIIAVYTVAEKDEYAFNNRMSGVIKADTNGDKRITIADVSDVITEVYGE